ncbi:MAG: hypothetical protein PHQ66_03930 [Candidatus Nanoarchaeia archaeon]|nr:hypothetical protein [Candidatus Nanoarchaeia archaeon]
MNALGKMLALDGLFALGMLGLARFAPETKKQIEETATGALKEAAPELAQQLEENPPRPLGDVLAQVFEQKASEQ